MTNGEWHVADQGDSIEGLAHRAGIPADLIWDHADNQTLREAGRSTRLLKQGDRVFVPSPRLRYEERPTEQRHRFVSTRADSRLHVRFVLGEEPRANARYSLTVDDGDPIEGVTDAEGYIDHPISPSARIGVVRFLEVEDDCSYQLGLSHLDPLTTHSGVLQRLRNLGFYFGEETDPPSEATRSAVASFQRSQGLEPTGDVDDGTRSALVESHGA